MAENATTETAAPVVEQYFVESPRGNIYQVGAQGRSDLVARGYRDITTEGGAEKFAAQHGTGEQSGQAQQAQPESPASSAPTGEQAPSNQPSAELPSRNVPGQGRSGRAGRSDQADDTPAG